MAEIDLETPLQVNGSSGLAQKSAVSKSLDSAMFHSLASTRLTTPLTQKSVDSSSVVGALEKRLQAALRSKTRDILAAFRTYDIDNSGSVTKGELRRVLELFCFSLTTDQFDALLTKLNTNANGTVRYVDLLRDWADLRVDTDSTAPDASLSSAQAVNGAANVDLVEKLIRERANPNVRGVLKAMQLFDYNRDRKIQRHELRKVIENYCSLKLTDAQFDKLWSRYDFHHAGAIDYVEFLQKIGVANVPIPGRGSLPGLGPSTARSTSALTVQSEPVGAEQLTVRSLKRPVSTNGLTPLSSISNGLGVPSKLAIICEQQDQELENFSEVERAFRARMKTQIGAVRKAFVAFDTQRDGFVELEDLKAVLREFVLPSLSDVHFAELMQRAGLKANGRVAWRIVLSKFEHPLAEKLNGQTLPIRNDTHHYNPVMGGSESVDLERLLGLLHDQVRSGYGSFKQAFLQIDYNRDGKISRSELRKVLERFKIRVSDEQFVQLLSALGMSGSQTISYHRFLEIFEPKDTEEHKWLKSNHRFNETQKPLNLAWRTVEELLCSRLTNNWKEVAKALANADVSNSRAIEAAELRNIIERYAFPVSDEHFDSLLSRCSEVVNTSERAKYAYDPFFERLGVSVRPSDASGVSAAIISKNASAERDRLANLAEARRGLDAALSNRTRFMSVDEVLVRLKDRIMLHNGQLHDAFHAVAQRAGVLHRRDVRKFLARIGMQLDDNAYEELLTRLRFSHNGAMTYADFVASFAERPPDGGGLAGHIEQSGNHRFNAVRGDERGLSVDVLEQRLRDKIRENFTDLRGAFHKFDETHSGTMDRSQFRKVLDSFMCVTNETEFEKLAARFGLATRGARIDYRRFLEHFETRDEPGAHRWLVSVHRATPAREPAALSAEMAHRCLVEKAYSQFHNLHAAFCAFDSHSRGFVTRRELAELLDRFQLRLAHGEFDRLWQLYDVTRSGKITYVEFVDALRFAQRFAPADQGTSQQIAQRNHEDLQRHADTQLRIQEQLTANQARVGEALPLAEVMRRLNDQLHEHYADVYSAFRKYDTSKKGYLTIADFIRVLEDLYLYLTEQQLADLLVLFGVPSNENRLSYIQFLKALEDRDSRFERGKRLNQFVAQQRSAAVSSDAVSSVTDHSSVTHRSPASVSVGDAEARLRRAVQSSTDALRKAFRAFDRNASGTVRVPELRRVLETFCFALTDAHFRHVLSRVRSCLLGAPPMEGDESELIKLTEFTEVRVNYSDFLAAFGKEEKRAQVEWLQELARPAAGEGQSASLDDVEARIHEFVSARGTLLRRAFRDSDYALLGVVSHDEFLRVLRRYVMRVTDDQAAALFDRRFVPENEFGNVLYEEFLAQHGCAPEQLQQVQVQMQEEPAVSVGTDALHELDVQTERISTEPETTRAFSVASSTLLSAERVERQLKTALGTSRRWSELQSQCRQLDPSNSGEIDRSAFVLVLERAALRLSETELQSVLDKYDSRSAGKFAYRVFLRNLLLALDEPTDSEQQRLVLRRKLQKSKIPFVSGDKSELFFETMLRIRARVLEEWRSMRRAFRERDSNGVGFVTTLEFRNVLKQYQIVLSEEEFYHLSVYFDRSMDGRIGYNEFIRAFLETA